MPTLFQIFDPGKTTLIDIIGGNAVYVGEAKTIQPTFTLPVTAVSKAGDAVLTAIAHGLAIDARVTIAGGVGSWAALNGDQIVKAIVDADNFSIEPDSSGYSGTFAGTVTTTAARTSAGCWRITKNYYDGGGNLIRSNCMNGGGENLVYDNRATLSAQ